MCAPPAPRSRAIAPTRSECLCGRVPATRLWRAAARRSRDRSCADAICRVRRFLSEVSAGVVARRVRARRVCETLSVCGGVVASETLEVSPRTVAPLCDLAAPRRYLAPSRGPTCWSLGQPPPLSLGGVVRAQDVRVRVAPARVHRRRRARRASHQSAVVRRDGRRAAAGEALRGAVHGALLRPHGAQQHHHAARHARLPALQGSTTEQQVRVVDPAARRAHPHSRQVHVYCRRALPGLPRRGHGHLDPAGEVRAGARRRPVRVPGGHGAQDEPLRAAQRRRAKDRDRGRVGAVREGGHHGEPQVRHHAGAGGARLHLLVPQRRARAQLRPQPRGDPHGARGARHHGGQPDHLQSAARGLRQLLVLAVQPGLGVRHAARAQRRAAGGHAARQRVRARAAGAGARRAGGGAAGRRAAAAAAGGRVRAAVPVAVPRRGRAPIAERGARRRPWGTPRTELCECVCECVRVCARHSRPTNTTHPMLSGLI